VEEATALGAAIVGGVAVGIFDDFEVAGRLSVKTYTSDFDPSVHERYGREYELFSDAYRRLEPWFEKL